MAALLPAFFMAVTQPVWSRVDEAQHADFVAHLAQGQWPVEGRTRILGATLEVMQRTGIYRWQPLGVEPAPDVTSLDQLPPPPAVGGAPLRQWTSRHLWSYSYEAAQPPLFYLLAVPFWIAGTGAGGALGGVYAVRLLDALLVASLAPLAAIASLLVSPSGRRAAASALVAATVPGLLLNGTAITNDSLVAALGGVLTVVALLGVRRGWTMRLALLAGGVFGAAMLAKLTAAGLAVGLSAAFLWPRLAGRAGLRECLRPAAAAAAAAVLVVAPWLALNLVLYRHPVPSAEADRLLGSFFGPPVVTPHVVAASFKNGFATFWTGEPWDSLPIVRPVSAAALAWCLLAAVGIQRLVRAPGSRAAATVVTALSLGTGVWAFTAMLLSHIGGLMPGRYAYPALVATAVVLVQGGASAMVPPGAGRRRRAAAAAALAVFAALCLVDVAAYAAGLTAAPPPGPVVAPAGQRESVSARGEAAGVSLLVDQVVRDPSAQRVYVHFRVTNGSTSPMEWWPVARAVFPDRVVRSATYAEGTPLPERLAAGASAGGWAVFDAVPAPEMPDRFTFGYPGVATDGYRAFGDLTTTLPDAGQAAGREK